MTQKKFLTAVDGSEHSVKVVDKAIELSEIYNAEIILIHCHKKFPTILGEPYKEQAVSSTLLEAEKVVKPHLNKLAENGIRHSKRLMEEPAGTQIANVAEIEKCDMIIMGSRGLTNLEGLIVGSTTHRVLHLATCSVLVVK
ncbi:universal stress protein [bacterium]|nr:universal stress protein [bacterium]